MFLILITVINESNIKKKHFSCKCEYNFDSIKCNSNQKGNNGKWRCQCTNPKEHNVYKEISFGILLNMLVKMVNT